MTSPLRIEWAGMSPSRREFLARAAAGMVGSAAASRVLGGPPAHPAAPPAPAPQSTPAPQVTPAAGTPPAFGTAPPVGPEISVATMTEAEKLVQLELTESEKAQIAANWQSAMAATMERRTGPRKVALETAHLPATIWSPLIPGVPALPERDRFVRSTRHPGALPGSDEDIAFAPVTAQS